MKNLPKHVTDKAAEVLVRLANGLPVRQRTLSGSGNNRGITVVDIGHYRLVYPAGHPEEYKLLSHEDYNTFVGRGNYKAAQRWASSHRLG